MLAIGIPAYRLPRAVVEREVNLVRSLGVEIRLNTRVGPDLPLEELRGAYQAVFLATGLPQTKDLAGVPSLGGLDFLRRANLGEGLAVGRRTVVVGNGHLALDCARVARRLGAGEVTVLFTASRTETGVREEELDAAVAEGIGLTFDAWGLSFAAQADQVVKITGPGGLAREADTLIAAEQEADWGFIQKTGLEAAGGRLRVNPWTLATSRPGVFAGGDLVHGASTVVEAVAAGNRAARAISRYLEEGRASPGTEDDWEAFLKRFPLDGAAEKVAALAGQPRQQPPVLEAEVRSGSFAEIEGALTNEMALIEARRCLGCARLALAVTGGETRPCSATFS
jgi:formate dehydrogenase beta subunit